MVLEDHEVPKGNIQYITHALNNENKDKHTCGPLGPCGPLSPGAPGSPCGPGWPGCPSGPLGP